MNYGGRQWPSKVKNTQKSICKVKSQTQKSKVDLRTKKSLLKVNFELEKSKSNVDF